jgi:hypothetical protein
MSYARAESISVHAMGGSWTRRTRHGGLRQKDEMEACGVCLRHAVS